MLRISSVSILSRLQIVVVLLFAGAMICPDCSAGPSISPSVAQPGQISEPGFSNSTGLKRADYDYTKIWSVSLREGISLAVNRAGSEDSLTIAPSISWSNKPIKSASSNGYRAKSNRSDRYKNTVPVVYRVTLKGYSIVEVSDNHKEAWSFDKVKDKAFRKPEIMISFTKVF